MPLAFTQEDFLVPCVFTESDNRTRFSRETMSNGKDAFSFPVPSTCKEYTRKFLKNDKYLSGGETSKRDVDMGG